MHQPGPLARGNTRPIRPGPQPNLPSSRCGSCDSVSRRPDARPPVASLRCSQSRLASSSPFPVHPKGLNPSLLAPALRPPVCPLLLRPPAPVQPRAVAGATTRRRLCIPSRAARPPLPSGLCGPQREFGADHRRTEAVCPSPRAAAPSDGARHCGSACFLRYSGCQIPPRHLQVGTLTET
jgi:hypothetical protein